MHTYTHMHLRWRSEKSKFVSAPIWGLVLVIVLDPLATNCFWFFGSNKGANDETAKSRPSPVIIIPGLAGSRAYSRDLRYPTEKPVITWLSYFNMAFPDFILKLFKLNFNTNTKHFVDQPNIEVEFPGFGDTWSVETLHDTFNIQMTNYYKFMVNELLKLPGMKKNFTLRGAPYDFRKYPLEWTDTYASLRKLIEETYHNSGNRRVLIVAHSMGNIFLQYFLKHSVSTNWQKKYIRAYVSMSAPMGGSVKSLLSILSGNTLGINFLKPMKYRELQRSFASPYLLLPHPAIFGNATIVVTPRRNYTAYDYKDLFTDAGFQKGYDLFRKVVTEETMDPFFDPSSGIDELHCIFTDSGKQNTAEILLWKENEKFPDENPEMINGRGDGTVSLESASACKKWKNARTHYYENVGHHAEKDERVVRDVVNIVKNGDPKEHLQNF